MRTPADYTQRCVTQGVLYKTALLALWAAGHQATILWTWEHSATRIDWPIATIVLAMAFLFAAFKLKIWSALYPARPALILFACAALASLLNRYTIDLPQMSMAFFLLGAYGWFGLHRAAWPQWSRGLAPALLLSLILPFSLEFSSGLGFGLRLVTASAVEQILTMTGIPAISSQDIIVIENAISHIDIPCSGLKSLWVGSVFFVAALGILSIALTLNTAWKYGVFVCLLLSANFFRVFVLTVLTSVYHAPQIAEILHVPLGVLGFLTACVVAWFLLSLPPKRPHTPHSMPEIFSPKRASHGLWILFGVLGWYALFDPTAPPSTRTPHAPSRQGQSVPNGLPSTFKAHALPLNAGEIKYFSRSRTTSAYKWNFSTPTITGSVLRVQSRDLNMFHAPELCMAAHGVVIDQMETLSLDPTRQIRVMSLNNGQAIGIYWLQSGTEMTDDFLKRYWRYLWSGEKEWTLFSIVLFSPLPSRENFLKDIVIPLYSSTQEKMPQE